MEMNKTDANLCYQFLVAHAESANAAMTINGSGRSIVVNKYTASDSGESGIVITYGDGTHANQRASFANADAFAKAVGLFRIGYPKSKRVFPALPAKEDAAFKSAFRLYLLANCPEYKDIEVLAAMMTSSYGGSAVRTTRRTELARMRREFTPRRLELLALFTELWRYDRATINAYINDNHKSFRVPA